MMHRVIVFGAAASVIILFVAAPVYTGRMPWEVLSALRDQGAAYDAMQEQLVLTAGSRGPIALARILTWPLVFAVLPFGVLYWGAMGAGLRALVLTTIGSIVVSSILRGTDREIADLITVVAAAGLVLLARKMVFERLTWRHPSKVAPAAWPATVQRKPSQSATIVAVKKPSSKGQLSTGQSNGPKANANTVAPT